MQDLPDVIKSLKNAPHITLEGVMSHLACADEIDQSSTLSQISRFKVMHDMLIA